MAIAAVALIIGGIAVAAAGAMARAGRLSRQSWVGIRTPTTMASDEAWDAAHEAGAVWIIVGGVVMALGGVAMFFAASEDAAAYVALATTGIAAVPIVTGGVRGHAAARRVS